MGLKMGRGKEGNATGRYLGKKTQRRMSRRNSSLGRRGMLKRSTEKGKTMIGRKTKKGEGE